MRVGGVQIVIEVISWTSHKNASAMWWQNRVDIKNMPKPLRKEIIKFIREQSANDK